MAYRIEVKPSAANALARIAQPQRHGGQTEDRSIGRQPRPRGTKTVKGGLSLYRIRIGDYRVIYQVQDAALLVLIVHRQSRRCLPPPSLTAS